MLLFYIRSAENPALLRGSVFGIRFLVLGAYGDSALFGKSDFHCAADIVACLLFYEYALLVGLAKCCDFAGLEIRKEIRIVADRLNHRYAVVAAYVKTVYI